MHADVDMKLDVGAPYLTLENTPSGVGMSKAGLAPVGQLSFRVEGGVGLVPLGGTERAQAGANLLGVPLIEQVLAPCWSCGGATPTYPSRTLMW